MNAVRKLISTVLPATLLIFLSACGGGPTPDPGGPGEASVRITPADPTMNVADTQAFTAVVNDGEGPQAVSWSSADEAIVVIDAAGLATALAPGSTRVTATSTADPSLSNYAEVYVREPTCLAPIEFSSHIIAATTLSRQEHPGSCTDYLVTGWLDVRADLVVEPGVIVDFAWGAGLFITGRPGGSLAASGEATMPIHFRPAADATGPWKGIVFGSDSPANRLEHVIIEGSGAPVTDAIYPHHIQASVIVPLGYSVGITNTLFRDAEAYGLWLGVGALLSDFSGNSFEGLDFAPVTLGLEQVGLLGSGNTFASTDNPNGLELIELQSRPDLTIDVSMPDLGVPYRFRDLQWVTGVNLTVEPGVTLQFAADTGLTIDDSSTSSGSFTAVGTADKPITLTADIAGAAAQHWDGLFIASTGASEVRHAVIGYGGGATDLMVPANQGGNIVLYGGARLTISDSYLHDAPVCLETLGATGNLDADYGSITSDNCAR